MALNTFLQDWKDRKDVIGAVATGSYANNTQTKFSDVDVHIIFSNKVNWRERGNKIVNGFLIEYFANPLHQHEHYMKRDFVENKYTNARMFAMGNILFDKTGEVRIFREKCRQWMQKPFKKPNKVWVEQKKYQLWDSLDTLHDLFDQNSPVFSHIYGMVLGNAMQIYCIYSQLEPFPPYKWHKLLTSKNYRKIYRFNPLPEKFKLLLLKSIEAKTPKQQLCAAEELILFVQQKMGGFEIDGWKLRSKTESEEKLK